MADSKRWLLARVSSLKVLDIERAIGCPRGTMDKWIKGERPLSDHWEVSFRIWLKWFVSDSEVEFKDVGVNVKSDDVQEEKEQKESKESPDDIIPVVQQNTSMISEDGKSVINTLPDIFTKKQGYKNMKRLEPNINYNGEVYEVYVYKEGKFEYCYCEDIEKARFILQSLKNK